MYPNKSSRRIDKDDLFRQAQASGRIPDILRDLCGVPNDVIEAAASRKTREFPCPKCGGKTRFRIIDVERGSVYCSHCCPSKNEGSGDVFGAVRWWSGCDFSEALKMVDEYLNGGASGVYASRPTVLAPAPAKSRLTPPVKTRLSSQAPANTPPEKTAYRYRDENGVERWRVVRFDLP
ncbi:MAG: hypothetical protein IIY07_06275, partial [Thermoguttaceae bacterium]|nr:hypothetical protein [Thermoguttaceae bacterium]